MLVNKRVIADSGFWMALYDPKDQYHLEAYTLPVDLDSASLLIPWPSLYETLNTYFVKDPRRVTAFRLVLGKSNVHLVDDLPYRDDAYASVTSGRSARQLSLVDQIIRLILADSAWRVGAIVTFNKVDFIDVCRRRAIEIVPT